MRKSTANSIIVMLFTLLFLGACSRPALKVNPIARTENPSAQLENLGEEISVARENRVDLLSPSWFASAQSSHVKAKTGIEKGTQLAAILENIATGRAQLAQARTFAQQAAGDLAEVIQSRDAALAAHADRYQKEFADLEDDFGKLTRAIEDQDAKYVGNKKRSVSDGYRTLELKAIKDDALGAVRSRMAEAKSQKLDRIIPKSFLIAQSKLADAEAIITQDRYNEEKIAQAVQQARFYAQRMNQIGKAAVQFEQMNPEEIALKFEQYFAQTLTQFKAPDSRNLSFDEQQTAILAAIVDLQRSKGTAYSLAEAKKLEIERMKQRIGDLEGRTYQERADKERLAAEKRFNELYNHVQGYFSGDEAEVYKQGRVLVIRLRAIQFPVGQAVILPANYPLLAKVQKAIDTFGKPDVTIEGHTDSTGSVPVNQELSQKRAESVRQYLVSNGTLSMDKITAAGYGSSRPLASNKTAKGRAVNRRIDVIIKPQQR